MSDAAREATREQEPVPAAPGRSARVPASIWRYGPPIMITLAGVGLWQLILPLAHVPEYLVPTPSEIAADMTTDWPVLEPALLVTAREILLGFVIAVAGGVGWPCSCTWSRCYGGLSTRSSSARRRFRSSCS